HPDSRGEILLRSADPRAAPRIRYNFFSAPNDLPTRVHGFKMAREMVHHKALDPYRGRELGPGEKVRTDAGIETWPRNTVINAHKRVYCETHQSHWRCGKKVMGFSTRSAYETRFLLLYPSYILY